MSTQNIEILALLQNKYLTRRDSSISDVPK